MYFYIIYPNGLKHHIDIENIIKKKFKIINSIDMNIHKNDMDDFFYNYLYKNIPTRDIYDNIKYLYSYVSNDIFKIKIYIIEDYKYIYFIDRGVKKNMNVEYIKRDICNKYNSKFKDNDKHIFPLNKGVSHNHVVYSNNLPEEYEIINDIYIKFRNSCT